MQSAVLRPEGGGDDEMGGAGGGAGGNADEFGVDPNLDPELAMVRRPCFSLVSSRLDGFVSAARCRQSRR